VEQSAEVLGEFAWHVKHGTIGDHVESLTVKMIFGETSSTRDFTPTFRPTPRPSWL
jgi:hypothetical protein